MDSLESALDFGQTLDALATWAGETVLVTAHGRAAGEHRFRAQTVLRGALGGLDMIDDPGDPDAPCAAGYAIGTAPNGFYMSAEDFVQATRAGTNLLQAEFRTGFRVEIQRLT